MIWRQQEIIILGFVFLSRSIISFRHRTRKKHWDLYVKRFFTCLGLMQGNYIKGNEKPKCLRLSWSTYAVSIFCQPKEILTNWFSLLRFGMEWYGLRQHPSEVTVKVSSQSNLAVLEKIYSWFSLVCYGMIWFGLVWDKIWSYCESFIKIRLILTVLEKI